MIAVSLHVSVTSLEWDDAIAFVSVLVWGIGIGVFIPSVRLNHVAASDRGFIRRHPGRAWFALLGVVCIAFAASWWFSNRSMGVRAAINVLACWGCQCDKCFATYGLVDRDPVPNTGYALMPVTYFVWAQWMIGGIAGSVALFMPVEPARAIARRADGVATRCTKCAYDMEGVPGAVCPECGQDCGAGPGSLALGHSQPPDSQRSSAA